MVLPSHVIQDFFQEALNHTATVNFNNSNTPDTVSFFETTIRYLGGMLSAFELDEELNGQQHPFLVEQSRQLGNRLTLAFSSVRFHDIRRFRGVHTGDRARRSPSPTWNSITTRPTSTRLLALRQPARYVLRQRVVSVILTERFHSGYARVLHACATHRERQLQDARRRRRPRYHRQRTFPADTVPSFSLTMHLHSLSPCQDYRRRSITGRRHNPSTPSSPGEVDQIATLNT